MIGVQREQDFCDDIEVVSSDGVSFQFNKAHLVDLCPALVTIIGSCKEETSKLVFPDHILSSSSSTDKS